MLFKHTNIKNLDIAYKQQYEKETNGNYVQH